MTIKGKILATSLMIMGAMANADNRPATTIFAMDISGSVGHLFEQGVANEAALYAENQIAEIEPPHLVRMVSVGEPGLAHLSINVSAEVTNRRASNPRKLSGLFGGYIRSLPGLVARGELTPQGTTSIIEFFELIEPICARGDTRVIMFTDGVEWSGTVDGPSLMSGAVGLPSPSGDFLRGCDIEMHGVGQVKGSVSAEGLTRRLVPQWEEFLTAAGANSVVVTGGFFNF